MTESMIERVALALRKEFRGKEINEPLDSGDLMGLGTFTDLARAAIEAMTEPTKIQLDAMEPWSRVSGHHEMVWKAGIKAALIWPAGSADRAGVPLARDQ